jgi:ribosomal-protein-alanine N-acetyltransferase
MNIKIEDATIQVIDELYEIEKQSFDEEAFSKEQIEYLLTDYNSISLLAKVEEEIAGFIIGAVETAQGKQVGHVLTIDVALRFRHMGVGERLMLELEEIYRQHNISEVFLEVRENNLAGLGLYHKMGYRAVSRLRNYYGSAHGLYLKKVINTKNS